MTMNWSKLLYCDSRNMTQFSFFHDAVFPTYQENHNTKICFFVNQDTKTKLCLAVTIKSNLNMHTSFFMKSYVFVTGACELY